MPSGRSGRVALAALIALFGALSVFLATSQMEARRQLEDRFALRIVLASRFIQSYMADILTREATAASAVLSGREVTAGQLDELVRSFGFEAAVLLDADGRAMQVFPARPDLIGVDLADRYRHLREAVDGTPTVSEVVPSAARAVPVLAFAAPYDTPFGQRVLSGAFDVARTPLATYLSMPPLRERRDVPHRPGGQARDQ